MSTAVSSHYDSSRYVAFSEEGLFFKFTRERKMVQIIEKHKNHMKIDFRDERCIKKVNLLNKASVLFSKFQFWHISEW